MPASPELVPHAVSFQSLAEIAVGDTARVELCRAEGGELLAVKRLHPDLAGDPMFASMFMDEIWMTAALDHPNVVDVAGWGSDAKGPYLAVELVQGVSLARLMKTVFETGEIFPEPLVVFIGLELCSGLAAAHALRSAGGEPLSLVHRDLTPGNVLVSFGGDVKIADFGLAKAKQRFTTTSPGFLKGKPMYMAPEQAEGLEIDARADLFSLGVTLFELFSGRRPWPAPPEMGMALALQNRPPLDLCELRPKIDKDLAAIVSRCLERDVGARFQTADALALRLARWLGTRGFSEGNREVLARFVRRNAMRQKHWFERAIAGELAVGSGRSVRPAVRSYPGHASVERRPMPESLRRFAASQAAFAEDDNGARAFGDPPTDLAADEADDGSDFVTTRALPSHAEIEPERTWERSEHGSAGPSEGRAKRGPSIEPERTGELREPGSAGPRKGRAQGGLCIEPERTGELREPGSAGPRKGRAQGGLFIESGRGLPSALRAKPAVAGIGRDVALAALSGALFGVAVLLWLALR